MSKLRKIELAEPQRRMSPGGVQTRAAGDDEDLKTIEGYAAVFYREGDASTEYQLWPGAVERIMPGAFDSIIADRNHDTVGLFNHDFASILGRTKADTLSISQDSTGLRYEIAPANTRIYQDTVEHISRGDVDGSSFAFFVRGEGSVEWSIETDSDGREYEVRSIRNVSRLIDVGPVVMPAYEGTSVGARSDGDLDGVRSEHDAWRENIDRETRDREATLRRVQLGLLDG